MTDNESSVTLSVIYLLVRSGEQYNILHNNSVVPGSRPCFCSSSLFSQKHDA